MKFAGVLLAMFGVLGAKSSIILKRHTSENHIQNETTTMLNTQMDTDSEEIEESLKKPCSIIVLSNLQHPRLQSLVRKYRYDSNGVLIPNSVRYFFKMPQGQKSTPILTPLSDKAFSPTGGFVRYYKEVPPIIPHQL